jgi:glyoxylase-like metal-dependent hydrolase (beta-lactamase superfamily II)
MERIVIPCGSLKVNAMEMHNQLDTRTIIPDYSQDPEGNIRINMNALLVDTGGKVVLFDPGCAAFLPPRFTVSYALEIQATLEELLEGHGYSSESVTDVIFTHLHFDHGSGAFARKPGRIGKRFPNARYHVLREHYQYAKRPDRKESNSFFTALFRYLNEIFWLEDWKAEWMEFRVFYGHTRGMVVPCVKTGEKTCWYLSDLVPMASFLEPDVSSGYDLDPALARKEKREFLEGLTATCELIFFHDPLKDSVFYP